MDTYHLSFIQNYLSKSKQVRQSSKLKPLKIPDRHGLFKKRKFVILFIKVTPEQAWPQQIKMAVSISPFFFKSEYVNFSFRYNIFKTKKISCHTSTNQSDNTDLLFYKFKDFEVTVNIPLSPMHPFSTPWKH